MRLASLLSLLLLLTACGQAGDLYLPGEPAAQPPAPVPVPGTTPAATTEPEDKKKD